MLTSIGVIPLKLLVVEHDGLLAMDVAEMLAGAGWQVVGPAREVQTALDLIHGSDIDGAILDLDLRNTERCLPVAAALRERGIPFLFASDSAAAERRPGFEQVPVLIKPFSDFQLVKAVRRYVLAMPGR